jgi:hypothetical protein
MGKKGTRLKGTRLFSTKSVAAKLAVIPLRDCGDAVAMESVTPAASGQRPATRDGTCLSLNPALWRDLVQQNPDGPLNSHADPSG